MNHTNRVDGISQKYDASLDFGITMYDLLPYERDPDMCNASTIAMESGHIVKYYLCNNQETYYSINNHDDQIERILQGIQEKERLRNMQNQQEDVPPETVEDVTQEQIQSLLEDSEEKSVEASAQKNYVSLDEVEDW